MYFVDSNHLGEHNVMNAQPIGLPPADDAEEDEPNWKSDVHATRELGALPGTGGVAPTWSQHPPAPLLPQEPAASDPPPARPRTSDVIEAAACESLGGDLACSLFCATSPRCETAFEC